MYYYSILTCRKVSPDQKRLIFTLHLNPYNLILDLLNRFMNYRHQIKYFAAQNYSLLWYHLSKTVLTCFCLSENHHTTVFNYLVSYQCFKFSLKTTTHQNYSIVVKKFSFINRFYILDVIVYNR